MKSLLQAILKILTRIIIRRHKPYIIGVTGSVGKTSTKEAIVTVLKDRFSVRTSVKNYNNEIGMPLTIIGEVSPGRSFMGWIVVLLKTLKLSIIKDSDFPDILVLEYAADKKGDIAYLKTIASPNMAVITHVSNAHLEFFDSVDDIAREKFSLIDHLDEHAPIFINGDVDEVLKKSQEYKKNMFIRYGFSDDAHIRAYSKRLRTDRANNKRPLGTECKIRIEEEEIQVFLPGVISDAHINSILPAIGVAYKKGITLDDIVESLKNYHVPPGRMKLLPGVKGILIIDDTYNSSPVAVINAVDTLHKLPISKGGKTWAVLGDMLELGSKSDSEHREVGRYVYKSDIDYLVTVGMHAKGIATGAKRRGMSKDRVFSFDNTRTAGKFIQGRVEKEDIILIKGSQGVRMEKIVKEIMSDPLRAKDLLVRQDNSWD
jgi:UDP-N-acetylmuramoyl-tripeptide--D-alanyl-D-alanine ligase